MSSSDYIYFNTKLKTLMSFFLKQDDFVNLIQTENFSSLIAQLQTYKFYSILKNIELQTSPHETAKLVEHKLWEAFQNHINQLKKNGANLKVKEIVTQISKKIEIENLKKIIVFVNHKKKNNVNLHISIANISPKELLSSSSIDNLLLKLEKTEYYSVLLPALKLFKKTNNDFHFSLVLEKYYFDLLFRIGSNLDTMNRTRLESIFSFMVEKFNLNNIIRFQKYYQMSIKEIIPYLYPKGALYPYAVLQTSFVWEDYIMKNPIFKILMDKQEEKGSLQKLNLFEQLLDSMFIEKIRAFLIGNPFSPGVFLAYYFLYALEIKKIIFLVNGKIYNLPSERLMRIM